jgi:AmmeMemoRadiSam system protein A
MSITAVFALPHPPLLIPGIGDAEKPQVRATHQAYLRACRQIADLKPETVVIFSPHASFHHDYIQISSRTSAQGSFAQFGLRGAGTHYTADYDLEFVERLTKRSLAAGVAAGSEREAVPRLDHGFLVPWHFIRQELPALPLAVRVGLSDLGLKAHFEFGRQLAATAAELGRSVVVVASGDLSHRLLLSGPYGFAPEGPEFDSQISAIFSSGRLSELLSVKSELSERAAECGLRSFVMGAGALDDLDFSSELYSYEGPFGVGYAVASFVVRPRVDLVSYGSLPAALARAALSAFFRLGRRPNKGDKEIALTLEGAGANAADRELLEQLCRRAAGVFVSLHAGGDLRGCIGTISPTTADVIDEIIQNAVSAAVEDPRFPPLTRPELDDLDIKVDVLGPAAPAAGLDDLDAQRFGVIVSRGFRRGLLLPALEGVDTPEQQVSIALQKAGIAASEPYQLQRFEVVRYREHG